MLQMIPRWPNGKKKKLTRIWRYSTVSSVRDWQHIRLLMFLTPLLPQYPHLPTLLSPGLCEAVFANAEIRGFDAIILELKLKLPWSSWVTFGTELDAGNCSTVFEYVWWFFCVCSLLFGNKSVDTYVNIIFYMKVSKKM